MAAQSFVSQIAARTGLPEEDVRQQILPSLGSQKTQQGVTNFLMDFLGPGPETAALAKEYIASRTAARANVTRPSPPVQSAHQSAPQSQRSKAQQAQLDFEERLPVHHRQTLRRIDADIASLTYSPGSSEADGPSKRQLKKHHGNSCFCHARLHPLSTFTPMCPRCALPLCHLQAPLLPCPSCQYQPLLASTARATHLERLDAERKAFLERVKEELRLQPERFPELAPSRAVSGSQPSKPVKQEHTVLSIGKGGAVTRTTHRPVAKKPVTPTPSEKEDEAEDPKEKPFIDIYDDAIPLVEKDKEALGDSTQRRRPFMNPFWPEAEREMYKPAERLDAA